MFTMSFIYIIFFFFIVQLALYCVAEESFYNILNVSNNADTKTIRKAFKKIAILKHPDKNPVYFFQIFKLCLKQKKVFFFIFLLFKHVQDDPNAHSVFIRINRAYEVLKDEDSRKKYDEHGEAGLDSNFNANQKYQSWQFYKDNFGIFI